MKTLLHRIAPLLLAAAFLSSAWAGTSKSPFDPEARLSAISALIESKYRQLDRDLEEAAQQLGTTGLSGERARDVLRGLCRKYERGVVDCATIDARGIMVAVEPAKFQGVEGKDISDQEQVERLHRTKLPAVSTLFLSVEGFHAIDCEWPVFSQKKEFLGSVSAMFRPYLFTEKFVEPEYSPKLFNVWVMQTDGKIIYSRDKSSVGDNFLPRYASAGRTNLPRIVEKIAKKESGESRYDRPPVGGADPERKNVMWKTISLRDTPFRVVIFYE